MQIEKLVTEFHRQRGIRTQNVCIIETKNEPTNKTRTYVENFYFKLTYSGCILFLFVKFCQLKFQVKKEISCRYIVPLFVPICGSFNNAKGKAIYIYLLSLYI